MEGERPPLLPTPRPIQEQATNPASRTIQAPGALVIRPKEGSPHHDVGGGWGSVEFQLDKRPFLVGLDELDEIPRPPKYVQFCPCPSWGRGRVGGGGW